MSSHFLGAFKPGSVQIRQTIQTIVGTLSRNIVDTGQHATPETPGSSLREHGPGERTQNAEPRQSQYLNLLAE